MGLAWLEGQIAVEAAIKAQSRPVEAVFLRDGRWDGRLRRLKQTAVSANIPVERKPAFFFEENASGKSHGGVLAQVGSRSFTTLNALLTGQDDPFIVMLDGIEDPFNFGQAIRALYAAGVTGLVVRPRNWMSAASVVARSSAGASEWMQTAVADTALEAASYFHSRGLQIACTARENGTSIFNADLTKPIFLLIGGEKRGITRSFVEKADLRLHIPYQRNFEYSLGAAASTAVIAFELLRQKSHKNR